MPEKFKNKLAFIMINAIFTLVIGFILLSFTSRGEKFLRTEKVINNKADIEYVDKQDQMILHDFAMYKEGHIIQHSVEYNAIQDQLDILIKWVESERRGD